MEAHDKLCGKKNVLKMRDYDGTIFKTPGCTCTSLVHTEDDLLSAPQVKVETRSPAPDGHAATSQTAQ